MQVLQAITPLEFCNLYGLQFEPFMDLLDIIREDIVDTPGGWGGVRASAILPPEVKLAMTLRASFRSWWLVRLDLKMLYGVSRSTFPKLVDVDSRCCAWLLSSHMVY